MKQTILFIALLYSAFAYGQKDLTLKDFTVSAKEKREIIADLNRNDTYNKELRAVVEKDSVFCVRMYYISFTGLSTYSFENKTMPYLTDAAEQIWFYIKRNGTDSVIACCGKSRNGYDGLALYYRAEDKRYKEISPILKQKENSRNVVIFLSEIEPDNWYIIKNGEVYVVSKRKLVKFGTFMKNYFKGDISAFRKAYAMCG